MPCKSVLDWQIAQLWPTCSKAFPFIGCLSCSQAMEETAYKCFHVKSLIISNKRDKPNLILNLICTKHLKIMCQQDEIKLYQEVSDRNISHK